MASHHRARRCTRDDVNWPMVPEYKTCPICGEPTWEAVDTEPLTLPEARERVEDEKRSRRLREEFEQFYAEREAERARAAIDAFLAEALG